MTTQQENKNNNFKKMTVEERTLLMRFFKVHDVNDALDMDKGDVIEMKEPEFLTETCHAYGYAEDMAKDLDDMNATLLRFCIKTWGVCKWCRLFPSFDGVPLKFSVKKYKMNTENWGPSSGRFRHMRKIKRSDSSDSLMDFHKWGGRKSTDCASDDEEDAWTEIEKELREMSVFYELCLVGDNDCSGEKQCRFCEYNDFYDADFLRRRREKEEQVKCASVFLEKRLIPELIDMISDYL